MQENIPASKLPQHDVTPDIDVTLEMVEAGERAWTANWCEAASVLLVAIYRAMYAARLPDSAGRGDCAMTLAREDAFAAASEGFAGTNFDDTYTVRTSAIFAALSEAGFALVPRAPTHKMLARGREESIANDGIAILIYEVMIAAGDVLKEKP